MHAVPESGVQSKPWTVALLAVMLMSWGFLPAAAQTKDVSSERGPGPDTTGAASSERESGLDTTDLPVGWYAVLETSRGTIVARLLPGQAPQAVAHFTALAEGRLEWNDPFTGEARREPYYDGTIIHLVKAGERFEVGDRTGTSRGGAPFYLPQEGFGPVDFTYGGRLGMTRASFGRISGSVFFVTESGLPWLNGRHPCFGVVVRGKDVISRIDSVKTNSSGRPLDDIHLTSVRIVPVGTPEPLPEPVQFVPKRLDFRVRDDLKTP